MHSVSRFLESDNRKLLAKSKGQGRACSAGGLKEKAVTQTARNVGLSPAQH